ncbi:MAG TPA: DNA topoisomerase IB [Ramlibacter sp.]|uniref:DNA topoisomerase IB n=1 Tax=Ramlibacter sp. TaxID=1917967 RepID=UPI002CEDBF8B|nr:DNA topoisomerase IB [Ramlibacter sp.]HVZ43146.1 DNA topoisomerase IB [Ramlibacter sp.]
MGKDSDLSPSLPDAKEHAQSAGLRYVSDEEPGLARERVGEAFGYRHANGREVRDAATLERIRKLAIPPAWTDVWICANANGHLQATGRDARGRKQYRYHPHFREVRDSTKYERMLEFARSLPAIRATIESHMALRGLPREKVLATVVNLLETTLIRIGNDDYARSNKSYGLTTLRNPHVKVQGARLRFRFTGKSGRVWQLQVRDRRITRIVKACQELPGQELFQYLDEEGELRRVTSADVNAYLREITGRDVTAKDFRTWAGTVMAALALVEIERGQTQKAQKLAIKSAVERVAERLGNTPTICRKCYIHPEVIDAFIAGELSLAQASEAAVLEMLEARLSRTLSDRLGESLLHRLANVPSRVGASSRLNGKKESPPWKRPNTNTRRMSPPRPRPSRATPSSKRRPSSPAP